MAKAYYLHTVPQIAPPVLPIVEPNIIPAFPGPAYCARQGPNVIADNTDETVANIFCFRVFANRHSGIVYHELTGSFLFMSFDSSICFVILFCYESNAILATPIAGLDNVSIFNTYKRHFEDLTAKGSKPKPKVMDNQVTNHIKKNPHREQLQTAGR
jgi:hypothetical protein